MGAANIIPGVSGGTVALITGIFEELINSIKSFDLEALKLLFRGKFKEFSIHINLPFLLAVFMGIAVSIISLALLLKFLFANYPIYIWAYFFGLILASVYFVGKTVEKWNLAVILSFLVGTVIALSISFLSPATENNAFLYLVICGVVAICSMILPGLSGSFVLILLGNYQLMIDAVADRDFKTLFPVIIGAGVGLLAFSHLLSWIFKKFRNQTISLLTGFILGSLIILWPWKVSFDNNNNVIPVNEYGAQVNSGEEIKTYRYEQYLPEFYDNKDKVVVLSAVGLVALGVISIALMEKIAGSKEEN